MSLDTCPKCGALVTAQLKKCRQCGKNLHGSAVEGALFGGLPEPFASAPATTAITFAIFACYLGTWVLARGGSPLAYSAYTLVQAGATHGTSMLLGEWWRVVTSVFIHHDALHLAFNVYALASVGPIVERLYGARRMFAMYVLAGAGSMALSTLWYVAVTPAVPFLRDGLFMVSAGASGAVCGMIGAAWVGAKRPPFHVPALALAMQRWVVVLVMWGVAVPGINNAAHAGGLVLGATLARVLATRSRTSAQERAWAGLSRTLAVVVVLCFGLQIGSTLGMPMRLRNDGLPTSILGMRVQRGVAWEDSDQVTHGDACVAAASSPEVARFACEITLRAAAHYGPAYRRLAELEQAAGNTRRAEQLLRVAARVDAVGVD